MVIKNKKTSKVMPKVSAESRSLAHDLIIEKLPGYFLIFCLIMAFYFMFSILSMFLTVIAVSAVIVIAFYPIYRRIVKLFRGYTGLAAFVSCLLVILVIIIPIAVVVVMIATEGVGAYQFIRDKVDSGTFDQYLVWKEGGFFYELKQQIDPVINLDNLDVKQNIVGAAQNISSFLVSQTGELLKSLSSILLNLVVMLFSMYYFFKDGDALVEKLGYYSPLPAKYEGQLFGKIKDMVKAIIVGGFLTSVVQGIVGGIGFAIAGIPNPIFWGAAMAFLSMVPLVGTAMVWVPAGIWLLISGDYTWGIFILLWGILLISSLDNLLRPFLVGGKAHTYPLITFFVLLGGVFTLGFSGIIIGPLVLMALMSLLHIYELEYGKVLKK